MLNVFPIQQKHLVDKQGMNVILLLRFQIHDGW